MTSRQPKTPAVTNDPASPVKRRGRLLATYRGRQYTYDELAELLHKQTGRGVWQLLSLIGRYGGRGEDVVRWSQTHRYGYRSATRMLRIPFEGREYSREALARLLAERLGIDSLATAIRVRLQRSGDDIAAVLREFEQKKVTVAGVVYPNLRDFRAMLRARYKVPQRTIDKWFVKQLATPEMVLDRAKDHDRKRRQNQPKRPPPQPVIMFGWRFSSWSAMARYYGLSTKLKPEWLDHLDSGKSGCWFTPLTNRLVRLRQGRLLDQRNRFDAATEARMPPKNLPLNSEQMPISDSRERDLLRLLADADKELEAMIAAVRRQ